VTVLEVIQRSSEFLARKGVDSPRLQVELLLAHVLQMPRMKLYLNFDRTLTDVELDTLRSLVKRRGEREPLQHIVGSTSFCGLDIVVNRDVLIPRPETELLAERALQFLSNLMPLYRDRGDQPLTVLDFGTGSGCLAVVIAARVPTTRVHAMDISEAALDVARQNAERHEVTGQLRFHRSDGFAALPGDLRFELIVSNPPYIPSADLPTLQAEVRDYEPHLALDGGADGFDFYGRLAREGRAWLKPEGRLIVELGDGQRASVTAVFTSAGWTVESIEPDYSGRERILIARTGV
jgi:release factor glutamine methyltransferase